MYEKYDDDCYHDSGKNLFLLRRLVFLLFVNVVGGYCWYYSLPDRMFLLGIGQLFLWSIVEVEETRSGTNNTIPASALLLASGWLWIILALCEKKQQRFENCNHQQGQQQQQDEQARAARLNARQQQGRLAVVIEDNDDSLSSPLLSSPNDDVTDCDVEGMGHEAHLQDGLLTLERLTRDIGTTIQESKEHLESVKSHREN